MGKVILVCSGKGGTGKTTFAVNVSISMAKMGHKVLLADLNIGGRNADIYLGMEDSILFDLGDVMSGLCKLDKAIIRHDLCDGLWILECPQYREIEGLGAGHVKLLYDRLKESFDYVIVDCPVSMGSALKTFASGIDAALLITIPDHSSIRNVDALNEKLEKLGVASRFYAINRIDGLYSGCEHIPGLSQITKILQIPLVGIVTEDPAINIGNNSGYPVALEEGTDMAMRFMQIAKRVSL